MGIRPFQLSDSLRVTELLRSVLSEECCKDTLAAIADQLSWDHDLVLVAVEQDTPVGVIIGKIRGQEGCFYRVAVHADYQRRGYGRALVEALQQRFEKRSVKTMRAEADMHNEPAFPLYTAAGVAIG